MRRNTLPSALVFMAILLVSGLASWYLTMDRPPDSRAPLQTAAPAAETAPAQGAPQAATPVPAAELKGPVRLSRAARGYSLTVEFLDDDLVHFELGPASAGVEGSTPIPVSPMVFKTDYPGPAHFSDDSQGALESAEHTSQQAADAILARQNKYSQKMIQAQPGIPQDRHPLDPLHALPNPPAGQHPDQPR